MSCARPAGSMPAGPSDSETAASSLSRLSRFRSHREKVLGASPASLAYATRVSPLALQVRRCLRASASHLPLRLVRELVGTRHLRADSIHRLLRRLQDAVYRAFTPMEASFTVATIRNRS